MKKISMLVVLLLAVVYLQAQQTGGTINGKITTADNKPAEGVTVLVKNTVKNAVADNTGFFEIKNVQPGTYQLVVSLVGYKDEEKEVTVENGKPAVVNIQLTLSFLKLSFYCSFFLIS